MKLSPADKHMFDAVMAHYGLDAEEIELAQQAYRNDPEAARQTYAALWREMPVAVEALPWVKLGPPQVTGKAKRA